MALEEQPNVVVPAAAHPAAPPVHAGVPVAHLPGEVGHPGTAPGAAPGLVPGTALIPVVARESLRRIPSTLDPISTAAAGLDPTLSPFRLAANSKVFGGLQQMHLHIGVILQTLAQPNLPPALVGVVHQPDGSAAARVQVQFNPASIGAKGTVSTTLTADDGGFTLTMPAPAKLPPSGLPLVVHGAGSQASVTLPAAQIAANGMAGVIVLPNQLTPLPVSIMAALEALRPVDVKPPPSTNGAAPAKHTVKLGEEDSVCARSYAAGDTTDRFPWGLFFRIVEPEMSIATHTREVALPGAGKSWMPLYTSEAQAGATSSRLVDRIPIDQPLSVDGFRDQIAGIDSSGSFTEEESVPMAASIGMGYILRLAQRWSFAGLGLGDLIYSLPLAPGEQQQIAVFERQDVTAVQEAETFGQAQQMAQTAMSDTSTTATFNQAFNEMVNGSSAFSTQGSSASAGVSFGIGPIGFGGGGGSSSSSGTASNSLQGSRDTTAQAVEATHSTAANRAAASLNAHRTGMRLASASESMSATTKIITNHNHTHALTMQYWEVVRNYDVTTTIEGVTLTCLIPMQVIRFMPPAQPRVLTDPTTVDSSGKVMERYKNILRHLDILQREVPREYQRGLTLLAQFAANPTTVVDPASTMAETVVKLEVSGNFLSCEKLSVTAVTRHNTRIGPVQLSPSVAGQPAAIPSAQFMTKDELTSWLLAQRQGTKTVLQASLAVPPSINRSDVVGFEIDRQFNTVTCPLTSAAQQAAQLFVSQQLHETQVSFGQFISEAIKAGGLAPLPTVTLAPSELESLLGGPTLMKFYAAVENFDSAGKDVPTAQETYANDTLYGTVLPSQPFPVPAMELAPVLRFQDVLEIEKSAQHIVRNTTRYSRSVWLSMTPEETAILLDGYTIGVPPGGLQDASQMIPLMNCLQNTIVGVFGNSLIMPFNIPQDLADQAGVDPAALEQALVDYQREAFVSPQSAISLPTHGVLGEAVLGNCSSAEKIDLTRFWNWQDAPADTAPGIGMVQMPTTTPPLTTGVTAPNSLTNLPPLINNLITAPQPNTSLLQAMGQQASSQPDFSPTLTGQQQLASLVQGSQTAANQARSSALTTSQTMATQAMQQMSSLIGKAMQPSTSTPGTQGTGKSATTSPASGAKTGQTTAGGQQTGKQGSGTPQAPGTGTPSGQGTGAGTPATPSTPAAAGNGTSAATGSGSGTLWAGPDVVGGAGTDAAAGAGTDAAAGLGTDVAAEGALEEAIPAVAGAAALA